MTRWLLLAAVLSTAGCATHLNVYDGRGEAMKGVPIRSPVLVEVTTQTDYTIAPSVSSSDPNYATIVELCKPTTTQKTEFLPLGEVAYVNFDPAEFGKSEFKVEFTDAGGTKAISVNSDPSAAIESTAGLIASLAPFIAEPKGNAAPLMAGGDLEELRKASCIVKSSKVLSIKRRTVDE